MICFVVMLIMMFGRAGSGVMIVIVVMVDLGESDDNSC